MRARILATTIVLFFYIQTIVPQDIPVINATSLMVDVREGEDFYEQEWQIMPEYKPDIYESSKVGEWITFITDKDSISYKVQKDSIYNFIILLNGKDSAYTQIKYIPSHLEILQGAGTYNYEDNTRIPYFYYQDSSTTELKTLRKELKLDSIAGGGNEVSKILNLMHWIHDLIPHDGQHENPVVRNALSMIEQCKLEDRGLNCRGLATVLNECYLALGIKSRFVTCMPKDSVFSDCHVINMVFSKDLDKWIWVDPTHDAYVMDEEGTLLGIEEVRRRLINGEMIILNPDANWNHKTSTTKKNYLMNYMAKNLYRFSCPLRSEYNYETNEKGKLWEYVELIPLDGYKQHPKVFEKNYAELEMIHRIYKTNNPDQFWIKPGM